MSRRALHEPAILYLIFRELSQIDLLKIQSVCKAWRQTINGDKRLLAMLFLYPSPTASPNERRINNPLLIQAFPAFFQYTTHANAFSYGGRNSGPWMGMTTRYGGKDWDVLQKYKNPEASWRRMLPSHPPATQLQVHVVGRRTGQLAWLNFSNEDQSGSTRSHPPWLTFGMIYDLAEAAWFQGIPENIESMELEFSAFDCLARSPIRERALNVSELRRSTSPLPGRVSLEFTIDPHSEEERNELRARAVEREDTLRNRKRGFFEPKPCVSGRPPPIHTHIFTDEFRFEHGISFNDVEWDDVQHYSLTPPEVRDHGRMVEERSDSRRRFLGISWGRKPR